MRLTAACLCLPLLLATACDSGESQPDNTTSDEKPAESQKKGESEKKAEPELPKVEAGMPAKQVVAAWGHPDLALAATEGIGCFQYEAGPKRVVCFSLGTEQATWPQVFGENYKVSEVRDPVPEDAEGATKIKKPVNPEPDVADN